MTTTEDTITQELIERAGRCIPCPVPFTPRSFTDLEDVLRLAGTGLRGLVTIAAHLLGHCLKFDEKAKAWRVYQGDQIPAVGIRRAGVWDERRLPPTDEVSRAVEKELRRAMLHAETATEAGREGLAMGDALGLLSGDGPAGKSKEGARAALLEKVGEAAWMLHAWGQCSAGVKQVQGAGIKTVVELMANTAEVLCRITDFDRSDYLLCVVNGVLDLRGAPVFHEHASGFMMTRQAGVAFDPAAVAGEWDAHVKSCFPTEEIGDSDADDTTEERVLFVQKMLGGALVPRTLPEGLMQNWGGGSNGKSVTLNEIERVFGDYAVSISTDTLLRNRNGGTTAGTVEGQKAMLRGARVALAPEIGLGSLSSSALKTMTSRDSITARMPYGLPFDFKPTHFLITTSNYQQTVPETDEGVWRRLWLVPWKARFKNDPVKGEQLRAAFAWESSGILNWLLDGLAALRAEGLVWPKGLRIERETYRDQEDWMKQFLGEVATQGEGLLFFDVWRAYNAACRDECSKPRSGRTLFYKTLRERLDRKEVTKNRDHQWVWAGKALTQAAHDSIGRWYPG